jgi:Tfp pilus assembly protein PilF
MTKASENKALICCLLIAITAAAYWRVYGFSFVSYDDGAYVTHNPQVQAGLTWSNLGWALKATVSANWHPMTLLSHMLDCQLFGLSPCGPHLTNLVMHILNVVLLFWVLQVATAMVWRSAFVAALFAIHPLNVESVAWISERKNVLSTMFFLLAIWAYIWYTRSPNWRRYLAVAALFALGLMAKPMVVTFPFVLLLLDIWPLGRLAGDRHSASPSHDQAHCADKSDPDSNSECGDSLPLLSHAAASLNLGAGGGPRPRDAGGPRANSPEPARGHRIRRLVLEKIPMVLMAAISSVLTLHFQAVAASPVTLVSTTDRIGNALVSYVVYIEKAFWPTGLAAFYPHPLHTLPKWQVGLAAAALIAVTSLVLRSTHHFRFLTTGWFWYMGTLIPVIGLVQVGAQSRADRYAYVPLIGIFIIVVWGVMEAAAHWGLPRAQPVVLGICAVMALALISIHQLGYWHDSTALFEQAERATHGNYVAYGALGYEYAAAGKLDQSLQEYSKAVKIDPKNPAVQQGYAMSLERAGQADQAVNHFRAAIELEPGVGDLYNQLGIALAEAGNLDEAATCFDKVLELRPNDAHAYANLGNVSEQRGDIPAAIRYYRRSIDAIVNGPSPVDSNAARAMVAQITQRIGNLQSAAGGGPTNSKAP